MTTHNDVPTEQCAVDASRVREKYPGSIVWQKWTCTHCGSRQMMDEANTFYASGTCEACGRVSQIERCNFAVAFPTSAATAALMSASTRKDDN